MIAGAFQVIGLLHFYKEDLPFHVAEFPFWKLQFSWKDSFLCIIERDWYIDTKSDDKESIPFSLYKHSALFYP